LNTLKRESRGPKGTGGRPKRTSQGKHKGRDTLKFKERGNLAKANVQKFEGTNTRG